MGLTGRGKLFETGYGENQEKRRGLCRYILLILLTHVWVGGLGQLSVVYRALRNQNTFRLI